MRNTEHLQKEKNRIKNTDRILRYFVKNKENVVSSSLFNNSIHVSNVTRLFQNLIRLGILKVVSRGKYVLSDYMLKKLEGKDINLLEIYRNVKELLEYHNNNQNANANDNKKPAKTQLTREDLKLLMILDGLLKCYEIYQEGKQEHKNGSNEEIINKLRDYLIRKYGHKYIDRTIGVINNILEVNDGKIKDKIEKIRNNEINNERVISFITFSKPQPITSIFDCIAEF